MALQLRERILASPAGSQRSLTREELLDLARSVELAKLELREYRRFTEERYARNTVLLNEHVELVVICWLPGQASAIHDHGRSNCLYLVVEGDMREEIFHLNEAGKPRRADLRRFGPGDITLAGPKDVHRILNDAEVDLVTVHLYSPPLDESMTLYTPIPTKSRIAQ